MELLQVPHGVTGVDSDSDGENPLVALSVPVYTTLDCKQNQRTSVESYLYRTYSPKCNEVAPTPGPVAVNLP